MGDVLRDELPGEVPDRDVPLAQGQKYVALMQEYEAGWLDKLRRIHLGHRPRVNLTRHTHTHTRRQLLAAAPLYALVMHREMSNWRYVHQISAAEQFPV
jgi:hypothetical protein